MVCRHLIIWTIRQSATKVTEGSIQLPLPSTLAPLSMQAQSLFVECNQWSRWCPATCLNSSVGGPELPHDSSVSVVL